MYLDAVLEVAIGLVITWLVLSIATMQVEEWISGWRRWRAQLLEESIARMLNGPAAAPAPDKDKQPGEGEPGEQQPKDRTLVEDFYGHPAVASLARPGEKPAYIPSERFAQTLFDVVFNRAEETIGPPPETLRLEDVHGIGPDSARRLKEDGIYTVEQLVELTPQELRGKIHRLYEHIAREEEILQDARKLLASAKGTRRG